MRRIDTPQAAHRRALLTLTLTSIAATAGCEAQLSGVPEGALARVGDEVITPEQLDGTHTQLDAYGQARFRGADGQRALLDALITEELLVQEARDAGFADDPRVEWAVFEELAELQRAAVLERRLPRASVAADTEALRARYEREREQFTEPERRSMRATGFPTFDLAEAALTRMLAGEATLEELAAELPDGKVLRTPLTKRDDDEYPTFHSALFDPALAEGDPLPVPVLSGTVVLIGEVDEIQPATTLPFDDPKVQEQLVTAERAARLESVEAELMTELRERYAVR
ncbi:peptidyl-prolyl cis-trans isomerase [Pseudenhygromyxa sp. WMMC2535]|uniref:peptidyl-prolyl cis-trans isomerase n=1 Tax=Pseudenhygromyxa sp. WMMC2535 TaxID=2712867 RepID=UPI001552B6F1|nr:peptidyl-prolyl cis-trans isomerase [Pseudenhygromyxa sp. WMMC2535]